MNNCSICNIPEDHEDGELRPYGKMGALICFNCMMSTPENQAEANKQFTARLDVAAEENGVIVLGGRDGPVPL
jgi:hypothetical protein